MSNYDILRSSVEVRKDIGHEITIAGVSEVRIQREATAAQITKALRSVGGQQPLIDFTVDEVGDSLYLLFGGQRA